MSLVNISLKVCDLIWLVFTQLQESWKKSAEKNFLYKYEHIHTNFYFSLKYIDFRKTF